jgi:hypothetical protein
MSSITVTSSMRSASPARLGAPSRLTWSRPPSQRMVSVFACPRHAALRLGQTAAWRDQARRNGWRILPSTGRQRLEIGLNALDMSESGCIPVSLGARTAESVRNVVYHHGTRRRSGGVRPLSAAQRWSATLYELSAFDGEDLRIGGLDHSYARTALTPRQIIRRRPNAWRKTPSYAPFSPPSLMYFCSVKNDAFFLRR